MSIQDPIADLLTRMRNAQIVGHNSITVRASKQKVNILKVLKKCGYILDYVEDKISELVYIKVQLKYYKGKPVISKIKRVSRSSLRVYRDKDSLPLIKNGLGIAILSTNKGIITDKEAREAKVGGEILCTVE